MNQAIRYCAGLISMLLLLTSCVPSSFGSSERGSVNEQAEEQLIQSDVQQELYMFTKLAQYLSEKLEPSLAYYTEKYGVTANLSVSDENLSWTNSIFLELGDYSSVLEGVQKMLAAKGSMPTLNQAASNLLPTLEILSSTISEADVYYKTKNYVDDDLAKGRDLHQTLIAAMDEAASLIEAFHTAFHNSLLQFYQDKLAAHTENNEPIRAASVKILIQAVEFNSKLSKNEQLLNTEEIAANYQLLAEQTAVFLNLSKDNDTLAKEQLDSSFAFSSSFQLYMTKMKAGATDIHLFLQANPDPDSASKEYEKLRKFYQFTFINSLLQYWIAFENVQP